MAIKTLSFASANKIKITCKRLNKIHSQSFLVAIVYSFLYTKIFIRGSMCGDFKIVPTSCDSK